MLILVTLLFLPVAFYAAVFLAALCDYLLAGGPGATQTGSNPPRRYVASLTSSENRG